MSYNDEIAKTEVLPFAELYEFTFPTGDIIRLTSYPENVEFQLNIYESTPITRSEISRKIHEEGNLDIQITANETLIKLLASYTLPKVDIKIYRYFLDSGDYRVVFAGQTTAIGSSNYMVVLRAVPVSARFKFQIPPFMYQVYCNNQLFDKRCRLSASSFVQTVTVTDNRDGKLTSSVFADFSDDYFTGGYVQYMNEYRLITDHVGDTIYLQVMFDESVDGKQVFVYPGCDKNPSTCKNKFNNFSNFTGFPYIPTRNPAIWGFEVSHED